MTTYNENLRRKSLHIAKLKLSEHRERGVNSSMSVFQVAALLDKIQQISTSNEMDHSIFYSVNLN